jgi:adenine-specific DNA methylase
VKCGHTFDLFQGYLLAENKRHPRNVLICATCGGLNEVVDLERPGACTTCRNSLRLHGPARRNRCECPRCGHVNGYPDAAKGPPKHRLFALEYHCHHCKAGHDGRFFKKPDTGDEAKVAAAETKWQATNPRFVPAEPIPSGDETDRLHRWGYQYYRELFNSRQVLGLELSGQFIAEVSNERVRHALATNLSDLLRYQNMLCRYDTMALKSLDVFSIHGFPIGHVQCESNLLGIANANGGNVGSGGWSNIIDKYTKAKRYCDEPFEVTIRGTRKVSVPIHGEWIGERFNGNGQRPPRRISLQCRNSTEVDLADQSLDAVFTDPPYFGNVQYGELMDFCYVWLRRLVGTESEGFDRPSTRDAGELTANVTLGRDMAHFTDGLSSVFQRMARALKPGAPLAFTYHHNRQEAYSAVGVAILDAELVCSATLPCPAEMGGSIHIHGTGSSIVDTVFVCRSTGLTKRRWLFNSSAELAEIVNHELAMLRTAGLKPSAGDLRCMVYGHLTRMAIWVLRGAWRSERPTVEKLNDFATAMDRICRLPDVAQITERTQRLASRRIGLSDAPLEYESDAVAF